ncbi:hypothetical protein TNCT_515821, partial [Trichonephila clavata]
ATDLKMAYHDNLRTIPLTGLGSESEEDGEIEKEMDTKDGSMATENRDRCVRRSFQHMVFKIHPWEKNHRGTEFAIAFILQIIVIYSSSFT